jgi:hypothetical protein
LAGRQYEISQLVNSRDTVQAKPVTLTTTVIDAESVLTEKIVVESLVLDIKYV